VVGWLSGLISIVAVTVSILAAALSLRSSNIAKQALGISRAQEERRLRTLKGSLIDALFDVDDRNIHYLLSVTIRNPADSSNSVSALEFWIDYHVGPSRQVVKISPRVDFADEFTVITSDETLTTPLRIEPGNTVKGWIGFTVSRDIVQPSSIDKYRLAIIDTHEVESFVGFALARKTVFEIRGSNEAK
jgi:hypothetical protein